MPRLFVAVWPSPEVVASVAALPRPAVAPGVRWTLPEQWHVTLRFLGRVADVTEAVDALGRVFAAACQAVLGPATTRFGNRVLHVPVDGLDEVAAEVVTATARVGDPAEHRRFHGHITVARGRRGADLRPFAGTPIAGSWSVGEITLVESHLGGPAPARYEVVRRFPLG